MANYAVTLGGNERFRCSVRPAPAITSSTRAGGNTLVNKPTDTNSDRRRSETGFAHPARGSLPNYIIVMLTRRYCDYAGEITRQPL